MHHPAHGLDVDSPGVAMITSNPRESVFNLCVLFALFFASVSSVSAQAPVNEAIESKSHQFLRELTAAPRVVSGRKVMMLDGEWRFKAPGDIAYRKATVPGCWQAQFPDLRNYTGSAEYSRVFTVPASWSGDPWIVFGAVDYACRVTVNGRFAGYHEGGYSRFAFNLAGIAKPGDSAEIEVTVEDSGPKDGNTSIPFSEIPHGKQAWFGNSSGIWQSVWLEERPAIHIKSLRITPDVSTESIKADVSLSSTPDGVDPVLQWTIYHPNSYSPAAQGKVKLFSSLNYSFEAKIPNARLWSPSDPAVYTINLSLSTNSGVDQYSETFGIREVETIGGRVFVNGRAVYIRGVLDQDFYRDTHYTTPSLEFLIDQFQKAKRLGFNLLRCHFKIPDPLYLRAADETGILVWYELPCVDVLTQKARSRLSETLRDAIERDFNHPSLIAVGLFDEGWGIDLQNADQRKWLISFYDLAKKLDPTRLIIDNSPGPGSFHLKSDIADYHAYFSFPDKLQSWSAWVTAFGKRPGWVWSPFGDSIASQNEPVVVSEFGTWGLPLVGSLRECAGDQNPWWFTFGAPPIRPEGIADRFRATSLSDIFLSLDRLSRQTQDIQMRSFKLMVEEIRKNPDIAGYVWTQLCDTQWESNGLLDMCRNVKSSARACAAAQQDRLVILSADGANFRSGSMFTGVVNVSNLGNDIPPGSRIEWEIESIPEIRGSMQIADSFQSGRSQALGKIGFSLPAVTTAKTVRIELKWTASGQTLSSNYKEITLLPEPRPANLRVLVDNTLGRHKEQLEEFLLTHGYRMAMGAIDADLIICGRVSGAMLRWLSEGGRVIILASDSGAVGLDSSGFSLLSRTAYGGYGDWCSSYLWFDSAYTMSGSNRQGYVAGEQVAHFFPACVVRLSDDNYWRSVSAGMFTGWLHYPAAVTLRIGSDASRVILSTLNILPYLSKDPLAGVILDDMISRISGKSFHPSMPAVLTPGVNVTNILPDAREGGAVWKYTTQQPEGDWTSADYNDTQWKSGRSGFGSPRAHGSLSRTNWIGNETIWLRWIGNAEYTPTDAYLSVCHNEDAEVFINGKSVLKLNGFTVDYKTYRLKPEDLGKLDSRRICIAVRCSRSSGERFIDVGLTLYGKPID